MGRKGHARRMWWVLLAVLILLRPAAGCAAGGRGVAALAVGQQAFYAQRVGGQVIGCSTYHVTGRERQGSRELFTVQPTTLLQVDVAGQTQTVQYCATTLLAGDYAPQRYELSIATSGGTPARITAARAADAWQVAIEGGAPRQDQRIPLAEASYLLDNNLFEQCAFLMAASRLQPGETRVVPVLVPQMLTDLSLKLSTAPAEEDVLVDSLAERALRITVSSEQLSTMVLWATPAGELLRLEIPAQNAVLERSDELAAFKESRSTPSNVEFGAFWNVDRMAARLAAKVVSGHVNPALFKELDYVTAEGLLVRIVLTADQVVVELAERTAAPEL